MPNKPVFNLVGRIIQFIYEDLTTGDIYKVSSICGKYFIIYVTPRGEEQNRLFSTIHEFRNWNRKLANIFEKEEMSMILRFGDIYAENED